MTETEMQAAVAIIRHGWGHRIPTDAIDGRVRQALPAITIEDLEAAFERASDGMMAEADELWQLRVGAPDGRRRPGVRRTGPP